MRKLLAVAIVAAVASPAAAGSLGTRLKIVRAEPLTVAGAHFDAGERVTVTAVGSARVIRRTVADVAGRFVLVLGDVPRERCSAFSVRAVGSRGTRAVLKLPLPACAPA